MLTLQQAAFDVIRQLLEIGAAEGRAPNIVDLHSIQPIDGSEQATVWLLLDCESANEGTGIIAVHVDLAAVMGVSREDILRTLTSGMMSELSDIGEANIFRLLTRGTHVV